MKIKKSQLEVLFNFLKGTEGVLTLAESRIRDTFIKEVTTVLETLFLDRSKIYLSFCIKDENDAPILQDGDKYQFPKDKITEIEAELATLHDEEVMFTTYKEDIKEYLQKSTYKPKVGEAELFDTIWNQ